MTPNLVDVWCVRLDQPDHFVCELSALLDEKELTRVNTMASARNRAQFVVAHSALRIILGCYTASQPSGLRFLAEAHGKPTLGMKGPAFSLSHSGALALVAVARDGAIGVDVERVVARRGTDLIARRFFTQAEVELLSCTSCDQRLERFYRLWACKESCSKADGRGISLISAIEVSTGRGSAANAGPWSIREIIPAKGYVGAVATVGADPVVTLCAWPEDLTANSGTIEAG